MISHNRTMPTSRFIALTAIFSALALVGNYLSVGIPNVEFGSVVLFIAAYTFGFTMAFWCTMIMSIVFSTLNPWGAFIPQIWIFQVLGWVYIITAGSILGTPNRNSKATKMGNLELALIGGFVTIIFDLVTNMGYSIAFSIPYFIALLTGLPLMVIHVLSNAFIFGVVLKPLHAAIIDNFGNQIWTSQSLSSEAFTEG